MGKKDQTAYTPDGELVILHDHHWVQVSVTLIPNPVGGPERPIMGATVLWRCTRRNCNGYRESKQDFRRPRSNSNANRFSAEVRSIVGLDW